MALIELKSDLSWHGKDKGFKPNENVKDTRFIYNEDLTSTTNVQGFANQGISQVGFRQVTTLDGFPINGGDGKRLTQLGAGTKFPIGPTGNSYEFDKVRFGFNPDMRYGDVYGSQPVSGDNAHFGLSKTYTEDSPIDDMYNKFNLRDDATPNPGYAKQPFILRGIQREGKSDPQRWGLGNTTAGKISSTFDIPRSGILTAIERGAVDVARIGKFLISPRGLSWGIKQFGLQLTGPNLEGSDGTTRKVLGKNSPKLWMPTSTLLSPLVAQAGMHLRRTGLLPADIPGLVPHNYEDVINFRSDSGIITNNRLINLKNELLPLPKADGGIAAAAKSATTFLSNLVGFKGMPIKTLSGKTGPDSILGIGTTNINRFANTSLKDQLSTDFKEHIGGLGGFTYEQYLKRYNHYTNPYVQTKGESDKIFSIFDIDDSKDSKKKSHGGRQIEGFDAYGLQTHKALKSLASKKQPRKDGSRTLFDGGGSSQALDSSNNPIPANSGDIKYYKTLEFGDLKRDADAGIIKSFQDGSTYEITDKIQSKYGYPNYPLGERTDAVDPIQGLEAFSDYGDIKDLIKFKFTPLRLTDKAKDTENPIIFRAFIGTLSDSFMPGWDENQDQGRADGKIMLGSWSRNISLDFTVPIFSRGELEIVYNKLDELARLTYPIYQGSGFTGTYVKVTVGDLYVDVPMYITDLSYDWDNETPWELEEGKQVPYYTSINMTLGWIGTQRPEYNTKAFSLNGVA
jgi:hypothetical protein